MRFTGCCRTDPFRAEPLSIVGCSLMTGSRTGKYREAAAAKTSCEKAQKPQLLGQNLKLPG